MGDVAIYNLADMYLLGHKVGGMMNCSLESTGSLVPLKTADRYAKDIAVGDESLKLKAGFTKFNGALIAQILGATVTTGYDKRYVETGNPDGSNQITVAHAATYKATLQVKAASGAILSVTTGAPAAGVSYSVAAGVYTFHASEPDGIEITYTATDAANGHTAAISNSTSGPATKFLVKLYNPGVEIGHVLYAVAFTGINFGAKLKDWTEFGLEGEACEDDTGKVWDFWYP